MPTIIFMVYANHMDVKIKFALKLRAAIRNDTKSAQLRHLSRKKKEIEAERTTLRRRKVAIESDEEYGKQKSVSLKYANK